MDTDNKNFALDQVAEIRLSYYPNSKLSEKPQITSSKLAEKILRVHWDHSKMEFIEEFKVMLLNRANRVMGIVSASSGGISGTVVDIKVIFGAAMKACASGIILSHNHPGGTLYPSDRDSKITERLVEAGKLLDIPVMDHIILTAEGYYSFADRGGL